MNYLDEEDDVRTVFLGLFGLAELTQHGAVDGEVVSGASLVVQSITSSAVTHNPLRRRRERGEREREERERGERGEGRATW